MSDPMTNTEIEDVLSSIRRLVSEELRPQQQARVLPDPISTAARPTTPAPGQAGKLLLTPALRVVAAEESDPITNETADLYSDPADDVVAPVGAAQDGGLWSDVGAADASTADDLPDDTFGQADDAAETADVQYVVSRLGAAVAGDDEWESPVGDLDDFGSTALSAGANPVTGSDAPVYGRPEPLGSRLHLSVPLSDESDFLDITDEPLVADEMIGAGIDDLSETMQAPQAVPLRRAVPPSDDDWADAAEAEVRAELEQGIEDEAVENVYEQSEVAFDEEVLRDLVRDIIREELSGSLGERITRNVRKLVRAEIARALAVREFE